jgi:hypothetical protein
MAGRMEGWRRERGIDEARARYVGAGYESSKDGDAKQKEKEMQARFPLSAAGADHFKRTLLFRKM